MICKLCGVPLNDDDPIGNSIRGGMCVRCLRGAVESLDVPFDNECRAAAREIARQIILAAADLLRAIEREDDNYIVGDLEAIGHGHRRAAELLQTWKPTLRVS